MTLRCGKQDLVLRVRSFVLLFRSFAVLFFFLVLMQPSSLIVYPFGKTTNSTICLFAFFFSLTDVLMCKQNRNTLHVHYDLGKNAGGENFCSDGAMNKYQ